MNDPAELVITFGLRLYQHRYIAGTEGNLSIRLDSGNILATRSGVCKGEIDESDLVEIDHQGKIIAGRQPSTEIKMHLEVYRQRPEVKAIIHAHPPYALSLTLAGIPMNRAWLPESVLLLGAVPVAPYARPSTDRVPVSIRTLIKKTDVILLERHGSLTAGKTLPEAWYKLEVLEATARVVWLAHQAGSPHPLPPEEVRELMKIRKEVYGLDYPIIPFI